MFLGGVSAHKFFPTQNFYRFKLLASISLTTVAKLNQPIYFSHFQHVVTEKFSRPKLPPPEGEFDHVNCAVESLTIIFFDHIGRFFADHDRWRIGVAADNNWHD